MFRDPKLTHQLSDPQQNMGELFRGQAGADVTYTVSGESISAHKCVLAARSPVFRAEFFGKMKEGTSVRVEIKGMESPVFKDMLCFIYIGLVPQLDEKPESTTTMFEQLLVAANRYGMDKLMVIREQGIIGLTIDAGNVPSTLILAERHTTAHGSK